MDRSETEITTLIGRYEVHNRTEGKSQYTVNWYNEVLGMFLKWLERSEKPTIIGQIDESDIREFILFYQDRPGLKDEKVSSHSVENRVRALRSFFAWVAGKGYVEQHIMADVKPPKTSQLEPDPLSEEDIRSVLAAMNPNTALGARNTAIVLVMLDAGLRRGEVAGLKEIDVHLEERFLKVFGKGKKERYVPFGVTCQAALLHYHDHYRVEPAHPGVDTFFLTIDGFPLSGEGIKSMIQRLKKSAGVDKLYPHLLRHTYGTSFILNGGGLYYLQQNMGHTSDKTTRRYVHIAGRMAAVKSQEFSPVDRMNLKGNRRFRHSFNRGENGVDGKIYPNAGVKRTKRKRRRSSRSA